MFDVGASELLVIVVVAVVVIGPKDLPMAMRTAGRWVARIRRVSNHFRAGIETMIREAEMEEMERKWKEQNEAIRIIGAQPEEGSSIPGIRKWPEAYLPKIFDKSRVDQVESVTQAAAEQMARRLAAEEGIFCGISAAGACEIALRISQTVENATIVFIVCDRGDRYLSTGVFPA